MSRRAEREIYHGFSECQRCGMGSKNLKPEALPRVAAKFGTTVMLACQICGRLWLQKPEESDDV